MNNKMATTPDPEERLRANLGESERAGAKALLSEFNGSVASDRAAFAGGYARWCQRHGIDPITASHRTRKRDLLHQSHAYLADPDGWPADERLAEARAALGGDQ